MKRLSCLPVLTAVLGLSWMGAASAEVVEYEGWLYGEKADEALEQAEKYGVPVVMIKQFRETSCPKCIGAGRTMASAKPNKEMVRIIYYVGEKGAALNSEKTKALFNKVRKQVVDPSNWAPDMYYMNTDGEALGFVPYEEPHSAREESKAVLQINEWIDSVPVELSKADKDAERGRYKQAMDKVDVLMDQDAKISHLIQQQIGKAKADAKMPDQPVSAFFPEMRKEKHAEYLAMAKAELDAARQLVEDEKLRDARRILLPLSRGPEDFSTTDAAKQLLAEVQEKLRK